MKENKILHTKYGNAKIYNDYYRITSHINNGKYLHRLIFEDFYGKIPDGSHIHHKDGNPLNNCIMNLQILSKSLHHSLHNKCKNVSQETMMRMSEARNTSGYYRVTKHKNKTCKQGFIWRYRYLDENGKEKTITSVDLNKLEKKVKAKGLEWYKF